MRKIHIQTLLLLLCSLLVISCNPISIYNNIVEKDEAVSAAWAQVENQYQRRADLIPNLVECVKGYAAHESETLENVIAKRKQSTQIVVSKEVLENEQLFAQYQQSQNALSGALSRLMAVAEAYPNLKANENFIALQSQLEGTENRISVERKRYNEVVQDYNTYIRKIPNCWFKGSAQPKQMFKAAPNTEEAPKVKF